MQTGPRHAQSFQIQRGMPYHNWWGLKSSATFVFVKQQTDSPTVGQTSGYHHVGGVMYINIRKAGIVGHALLGSLLTRSFHVSSLFGAILRIQAPGMPSYKDHLGQTV